MNRVDHDTAATDLHGPDKDGFQPEPRAAGVAATVVPATFLNDVQEEILGPIEDVGITPLVDTRYQLRSMLRLLNAQLAMGVPPHPSDSSTASGGDDIKAIAFGQAGAASSSEHVAVGENGTILTSNDGIDYTLLAPDGGYTGEFADICSVTPGGPYVAVGAAGEIQSIGYSGAYVATQRETGAGYALRGVAYSPSLNRVCAVGTGATIRTATGNVLGTWTARTAASSYAGDFNAVAWSATLGLFIAVGTAEEIQTSPDGITWTRRNTGANALESVKAGADGVVAAHTNGAAQTSIMRSTDGITWADVDTGSGTVSGKVLLARDVFIVQKLATSTTAIDFGYLLSPDGGLTWYRKRMPTHLGQLLFCGRRFHWLQSSTVLGAGGAPAFI